MTGAQAGPEQAGPEQAGSEQAGSEQAGPEQWGHRLWQSLLPIGRNEQTSGYRRYTFTQADAACRLWFLDAARERDMRAEVDGNGNLWAWWDPPARDRDDDREAAEPGEPPGAIVTGSHLDSVPDGGAFDGPLGVVSAFAAIDVLRQQEQVPVRPLGVVAFAEEEGGRFGVACLGSRLLTGAVSAEAASALTDAEGTGLPEAMTRAGLDPQRIGPDPSLAARIAAFVELHIEQGSALDGMDAAVGVAESIWPHGRWRIDFAGRADHAGTTRIADRRDPMLPFAATVLAARTLASELGALATFGRVTAEPGAANAISSAVHAWLDARAPDEDTLKELVSQVTAVAELSASSHGVSVTSAGESLTPLVVFDQGLRDRIVATLAKSGVTAPVLPTGAGHDAGMLAAALPTAMLFVRNRTGVSHSPAEHADPADCEAGVAALAAVLSDLACG